MIDCIEVQERKVKLFSCVHAPTKREIRHFHTVVVQ